eukprot:2136240-Alexandrium_andersonii.AAC.1
MHQAALRLAFRSVCRGWAWAPRWLPAGMGPLFGVSGCPRRPVTLAWAVGVAVAHSGRLWGPAALPEGARE